MYRLESELDLVRLASSPDLTRVYFLRKTQRTERLVERCFLGRNVDKHERLRFTSEVWLQVVRELGIAVGDVLVAICQRADAVTERGKALAHEHQLE